MGPVPDSSSTRLRTAGLRVTKPRVAVLEVLDEAGTGREHLTVAAVAHRARARLGSLSTQAVYDCLEAMTAAGVVRRIEPAGHPSRYETRVGDNHHHLICRRCGLTTDVDCGAGSVPCLTPSDHNGYVVDEAEVTFWGLCPDCAAAPAAPADKAAPESPTNPGGTPRTGTRSGSPPASSLTTH